MYHVTGILYLDSGYYIVSERKLRFFVKVKSKIPDFEREKTKILTTVIRIVFRGLKFESYEDIGETVFVQALHV